MSRNKPMETEQMSYWKPIASAPDVVGSRILYMTRYGEIGHARLGFYEDDETHTTWWDEHRDDEACPVWWADPLPMSETGEEAQEQRRTVIAAIEAASASAPHAAYTPKTPK